MPSTSLRPSRDKPIRHVELRVSIKADPATVSELKKRHLGAKATRGGIVIKLSGDDPGDVSASAKELLEEVRRASFSSKRV